MPTTSVNSEDVQCEKSIEEEVSETTHTVVVLINLASIAIISMFVTDLTIVFGIIAAFSEAFVNAILAGVFLITTEYNSKV